MSDVMNIQKVFSPISAAQRVRRLKKRDSDSQKRRFDRDFEEEKDSEKNEKENLPTPEMKKTDDEKGKQGKEYLKTGLSDSDAQRKNFNSHEAVGTLVDIRL